MRIVSLIVVLVLSVVTPAVAKQPRAPALGAPAAEAYAMVPRPLQANAARPTKYGVIYFGSTVITGVQGPFVNMHFE